MSQPTIEQRLAAIEAKQKTNDDLIEIITDVRNALKVLVLLSRIIKWVAGIVIAISAAYGAFKNLIK